jgi:stress-induced morphogen
MLTQQGASDSKVKDNIQDYTTGLSLINQLEPKTWNWNDSQYGDISKTNYGLMADDLAAIDSSYTKVHSTDETHGEIKTISEEFANQYNVALLKAVKELSAKNDALEARIVELEGKL